MRTVPGGIALRGRRAVASAAVSRALMAELGVLARQVAALGTGLVMSPSGGWADTSPARQAVAGACQGLRVLYGGVRAAHRRDPVLASDCDLLCAIPVSVMPARLLPDGGEPVGAADCGAGGVVAGDQRGVAAACCGGEHGRQP
jgi:hypothetical protein